RSHSGGSSSSATLFRSRPNCNMDNLASRRVSASARSLRSSSQTRRLPLLGTTQRPGLAQAGIESAAHFFFEFARPPRAPRIKVGDLTGSPDQDAACEIGWDAVGAGERADREGLAIYRRFLFPVRCADDRPSSAIECLLRVR